MQHGLDIMSVVRADDFTTLEPSGVSYMCVCSVISRMIVTARRGTVPFVVYTNVRVTKRNTLARKHRGWLKQGAVIDEENFRWYLPVFATNAQFLRNSDTVIRRATWLYGIHTYDEVEVTQLCLTW